MAKLVSKTYGDAFFQIAEEAHKVDEFYQEVLSLQTLLAENVDLQKTMEHPEIVKEEKIKILEDIFRGKISEELLGLVCLLEKKGHYNEIDSVFEYIIKRIKDYKGIGIVYVTTPLPLGEDEKQAITKRLQETTTYKSFEFHYQVDQSLIGGIVIQIGDRVVDSSIKTKIEKLQSKLKAVQI